MCWLRKDGKMIICFHHSDLDGMGVKLLTMLYAKQCGLECETYKCDYTDVDDIIRNVYNSHTMNEVDEVIVGDISPSGIGVVYLDSWDKNGILVRLRDHHKTAEHLNKYAWAVVQEKFEGVERCGTWLLSQDTDFHKLISEKIVEIFVQVVDSWDTWKWKKSNDIAAKNLNAIFQILGETDFTEYMLNIFDDIDPISNKFKITKDMLFNVDGRTLIKVHERQVRKSANKCIKDMWTLDLKVPKKSTYYKTAIIFASNDLSDIADIILSEHPEIDILMMISFPKSISYRTQKKLDIPLGDIAKYITGSGGGHPQSAGSTISERQFYKTFKKTLETLSSNPKGLEKGLEFTNLNKKE